MLTRLRLDNYRCFDAFDQALGDYVVLVGANGSGKSTLLDSLVLLGDLAGARTCNLTAPGRGAILPWPGGGVHGGTHGTPVV